MAGNIIPAIATTNAMTAGLCVLMSLKVLKDDYENAKMVRYFIFCLLGPIPLISFSFLEIGLP